MARFYDISIKDITGQSRKKELVKPRQIIMYIMREEINTSFPTIGQELGGRDHTTIIHDYNKIKGLLMDNNDLEGEIKSIKDKLYSVD